MDLSAPPSAFTFSFRRQTHHQPLGRMATVGFAAPATPSGQRRWSPHQFLSTCSCLPWPMVVRAVQNITHVGALWLSNWPPGQGSQAAPTQLPASSRIRRSRSAVCAKQILRSQSIQSRTPPRRTFPLRYGCKTLKLARQITTFLMEKCYAR